MVATFYFDRQLASAFERIDNGRKLTLDALNEHAELAPWLRSLATSIDEVQYSVRLEQSLRSIANLKSIAESQELETAERVRDLSWLAQTVIDKDLLNLRVARRNWKHWEACDDALQSLKALNFSILRNLGVEGAQAKMQALTEDCSAHKEALKKSETKLLEGLFALAGMQATILRVAFVLLFISSTLALIRLTRLTVMVRKLTRITQFTSKTTNQAKPSKPPASKKTLERSQAPPSQPAPSGPTSQSSSHSDPNVITIDLMGEEITGVANEKLLSVILPAKVYRGRRLPDIIAEKVGADLANSTRQFIDYLRMRTHHQAVIDRSNPLKQFTVPVPRGGQNVNSTFQTRFRYIDPSKSRRHLQVLVRMLPPGGTPSPSSDPESRNNAAPGDQTQPINLQSKKVASGNTSAIDLGLLNDFLYDAQEELHEVVTQATRCENKADQLQPLIEESFRIVHKMKGDAGMLNLDKLVEKSHASEDSLNSMLRDTHRGTCDKNRFIKELTTLETLLSREMDATKRLPSDSRHTALTMSSITEHLLSRFQTYIDAVANKYNKSAKIINAGFNAQALPSDKAKDIISMMLQLIRNATFHGIEDHLERKKKGKKEQGSIQLSLTQTDREAIISVRDDGRGLDTNQIRSTARRLDMYTEDLDHFSASQLHQLIFSPGFSTSEKVDQNAGRGIGLDLVKSTISRWGGSIEILSEVDRFCEFRLKIPL